MCKCQNCGSNYEIPKNTTNFAYMRYCLDCQIKAIKSYSKKKPNEIIKSTAKNLGL